MQAIVTESSLQGPTKRDVATVSPEGYGKDLARLVVELHICVQCSVVEAYRFTFYSHDEVAFPQACLKDGSSFFAASVDPFDLQGLLTTWQAKTTDLVGCSVRRPDPHAWADVPHGAAPA